mmetsp:Transcript_44247/g.140694  ORF Transcript_44247/g.140694 Transcript_44247/m.140694 type:complete len:153 (+) Transcript_44247:120-578(+)
MRRAWRASWGSRCRSLAWPARRACCCCPRQAMAPLQAVHGRAAKLRLTSPSSPSTCLQRRTRVEAEAAGEVLRFVGAVDVQAGTASVKLGRYPKDHPFASTQFADNIVTYDTKWYRPRPLVVQGPGAGAAVTAAGIFGNIMEVMSCMRRPRP